MRMFRPASWIILTVVLSLAASIDAYSQTSMIPNSAARYGISSVSADYKENIQEYVLRNMAVTPEMNYMISLRDQSMRKGLLSVKARHASRQLFIPFFQGGFYIRNATGEILSPIDVARDAEIAVVNHSMENNRVTIDYTDTIDEEVLSKRYTFELVGNTMVMQLADTTIRNTTARYVGFHFDRARFVPQGKLLDLPGAPFPIIHCMNEVFLSTYVDPTLSNTSRYEETRDNNASRLINASNTPAWLSDSAIDNGQRLNVTAYLTLSEDWVDVLPSLRPPVNTEKPSLVIDVSEAPMAKTDALPYHVVRRWESPNNGLVDLNAQFSLTQGGAAIVEVILIEQAMPDTPRLLYSQVLNRGQKPTTAIEGQFPIQKGDQILFAHKGPHTVSGGTLQSDIKIRLGNILYDNQFDFGPEQGKYQWYYEEVVKGQRSPMVWNPQTGRYESLHTRAHQTANALVSLSAPQGDAFTNAEAFLDQLDRMGIRNYHMLARGWVRNATPDIEASPTYWGSEDTLNRILATQRERGNEVLFDIPQNTVVNTALQAIAAANTPLTVTQEIGLEPIEPKEPLNDFLQSLGETVTETSSGINTDGVVIQVPHPSRFGSLLGHTPSVTKYPQAGSSQTTRNVAAWSQALRNRDTSLYTELIGHPELNTFLPMAPAATGIFSPYIAQTTHSFILDPYLRLQSDLNWIGLGGYNAFISNQLDAGSIDPRFFPMDSYYTYTLMLRRIPQVSGRVWHPGLDSREQRKHWLESISLLQPVAENYTQANTSIVAIHYLEDDDWAVDLPTLLNQATIEPIDHVRVQYSNGLIVYANTGTDIWRVLGIGLIQDRIAPGGFLAVNGQQGLISIIGNRYERAFSACITQDYVFINSRDRELFEYEPFATDGVCRLNRTAFADRWDLVALDATEVLETDMLSPLFRSNQRIDLLANWVTPQRIEVEILEIDEGETLFDWFVLPEAETAGSTVQVMRERTTGENTETTVVDTTSIRAGIREGVRMSDVRRGDRLTFTRSLPGAPGT